ncbi:MAG: hypothetical protein IJZ35_06295 [Clostridia bacterium]|nr:hypothetical protein [Clostridia bacterium]
MKPLCTKITSVIVAIMLIIPAFSASAYTTDDVVEAASGIIFSNEGSYTSINANDRGAVSIGVLGWHADRALSLLKTVVDANPENALELLGEELYNEILTDSNWNYRTFNSSESDAVSALLGTQEGIDAQNELAATDIKSYVNRAITAGITDGKALVYYADLENQMGSVGAERVALAAISLAGSADKVTLDDMYNAALGDSTASSSPTRRKNTYNACLKLDLDNLHESDYCAGEYVTTASLLCVRSGPSTAYNTVTSDLKKGTNVVVTEVSGEWGKINVNGVNGWICLRYANLIKAAEIIVTVTGDVTGNNSIEAADARLILRYSANLTEFSESQIKCADVNGDNTVTAQDARKTLRVSAGLENL